VRTDRDEAPPERPRPVSMFEPVRPVDAPAADPTGRDQRPVSMFEPVTPPRPGSLFEPMTPPSTSPPESPAERTMHLPAVVGPPPDAPEPTVHLEPEPTVHLAPDGPPPVMPASAAETTNPLPRVPAAHGNQRQGNQPEHLTVGLPLLDLLAPQQPYQSQDQGSGQYVPHGPYASEAQYAPDSQYVSAAQYPQEQYPQEGSYPGSYEGHPYQAAPPPRGPQRGPRRRPPLQGSTKLVIGLGAGVVLLVVLGVWALLGPSPDNGERAGGTRTSPPQATSAVRVADGFQFTQSAARTDADCAANAYGAVVEFFRSTPCAELDRVLYLSTVDGKPAVVSLVLVRMPDEAAATELQKLVDTSGTGNITDLLKAGVQAPGGPPELTNAGYASMRDGATVVIAEADFADPAQRDQATLDRLSTAALQLRE